MTILDRLFAPRCVICDRTLAAGTRPQARTCSDKCRQALSRSQRAEQPLPVEPAPTPAHNAPISASWLEQDPADDHSQRHLGHWVNPDEQEETW